MNTETLTVHPKGDDFEIIVEHDQTGSAYGTTLSKSAYEQLRLHFVSDPLKVRDIFNAGFDEGYTSPMERDGKPLTEQQYEDGRKANFEQWLNDR